MIWSERVQRKDGFQENGGINAWKIMSIHAESSHDLTHFFQMMVDVTKI